MTLRSSTASIALLVAATSLLACDGLGRPVVGEFQTGEGAGACYEVEPPACPHPTPAPPPLALSPRDQAWAQECLAGVPLREMLSSEVLAPGLRCRAIDVALAPFVTPAIGPTHVRASELVFRSEQPTTVRLMAATLENVRIELAGPITLEVTGKSALSGLRIELTHPNATLKLRDAVVQFTTIDAPSATVDIARTRLLTSMVVAEELIVEASSATDLDVDADRFFAARFVAVDLGLQTGRAQIADSRLTLMRLERCASILISASEIDHSRLRGCSEEELRLDFTFVNDSQISGRVEGVGTSFRRNAVGGGEPSSIVAYRGNSFAENVLCAELARVVILEIEAPACNRCEALGERATAVICGMRPTTAREGAARGLDYDELNPECPPIDELAPCEPPVTRVPIQP